MVSITQRLSCHVSEKYMMAVIVGTIGGVAVIAFIVAAVRYVGQNNKKWVTYDTHGPELGKRGKTRKHPSLVIHSPMCFFFGICYISHNPFTDEIIGSNGKMVHAQRANKMTLLAMMWIPDDQTNKTGSIAPPSLSSLKPLSYARQSKKPPNLKCFSKHPTTILFLFPNGKNTVSIQKKAILSQ